MQPVLDTARYIFDLINENRAPAAAFFGVIAIGATAFGLIELAQLAAAAAAGVMTAAQWLLNAALTANPIGAVILVIAAMAAGLVILYQHSETARTIINTAFRLLKTVASETIGFITGTVLPGLGKAWDIAKAAVKFQIDRINEFIDGIKGVIQVMIKIVKGIFNGDWATVWDGAKEVAKGLLKAVDATLGGIPGKIFDAFDNVYNAAKRLGGKIVSGAVDALSGLGSTITGMVKGAFNSAIGILNSGFNAVKSNWPDIPGAPGPPFGKDPIPTLANGMVVRRAMMAVIGEAGPEVVIPLNRPQRARELMGQAGIGGDTHVTQNFHEIASRPDPVQIGAVTSFALRNMRV